MQDGARSTQDTPELFEPEDFNPEDLEPRRIELPPRHRVLSVVGLLGAIALLAFVPPLINVGRYRKQIASSIGASLGRPVRIDAVTLNLLPLPGFTLENFVVGEQPAFGAEPVLRANQVRATLRVGSLWRRRMEFSRISLTDASVNLVHLPDGQWNLESILLQAARVHAAPTAQSSAGEAPRFPYIEATGARINVKDGLDKRPISLTDATLALWQPEPDRWRLRLEAHPTRTDAAAMDTGLLRVEATLGRAGTLAEVPLSLDARWTAAPLGAVSTILTGRDADMRGDLTLTGTADGTVGDNRMTTRLELKRLRRADFVPDHTLSVDLRCDGRMRDAFHRLDDLHCLWPAQDDGRGLTLTATVPSLHDPRGGSYTAELTAVPASVLPDALRVVSARVPSETALTGLLAGHLTCCNAGSLPAGTLTLTGTALHGPAGDGFSPQGAGTVTVTLDGQALNLEPVLVDLGGAGPATLNAHADRDGYTLHLAGSVLPKRLRSLAEALPQFGDGLTAWLPAKAPAPDATTGTALATNTEQPIRLDLTAARTWSGGQSWTAAAPAVRKARLRSRYGRRP